MLSAQPLMHAADEEVPKTIIIFCGQHFEPLPSGALFWPKRNALLVADLHFEKMSSFARSGLLFPPYDTRLTLKKLAADITTTGTERVFCLGDSFHRDEGTETLDQDDAHLIRQLVHKVNWTWLAGNHDPSPHELGGNCCTQLRMDGVCLTHEPGNEVAGQIAGHLHPAARLGARGRSTRRRCFAYNDRLLILPAYGASTGSLNVLSAPFAPLWGTELPNVVMLGRGRVYAVNPRRLVGD